MKYLTVLGAVALAMALPCTALADEAWDAECEGRPMQQANAISGADFQRQGVVEYNGREETWYSSNVAYHYRTGEWTPDSEGFYKTDEGYFVVASDAYEQGTVIETSRGLAQVLDSGCGENIDFYTNF